MKSIPSLLAAALAAALALPLQAQTMKAADVHPAGYSTVAEASLDPQSIVNLTDLSWEVVPPLCDPLMVRFETNVFYVGEGSKRKFLDLGGIKDAATATTIAVAYFNIYALPQHTATLSIDPNVGADIAFNEWGRLEVPSQGDLNSTTLQNISEISYELDNDGVRSVSVSVGAPRKDEEEAVKQHRTNHVPAREAHEVVEVRALAEPIEVQAGQIGTGAADGHADERVHGAGKGERGHRRRFEPALKDEECAESHCPERDCPEAPRQVRHEAQGRFETGRIKPADRPHQGVVEIAPTTEGCISHRCHQDDEKKKGHALRCWPTSAGRVRHS